MLLGDGSTMYTRGGRFSKVVHKIRRCMDQSQKQKDWLRKPRRPCSQ